MHSTPFTLQACHKKTWLAVLSTTLIIPGIFLCIYVFITIIIITIIIIIIIIIIFVG